MDLLYRVILRSFPPPCHCRKHNLLFDLGPILSTLRADLIYECSPLTTVFSYLQPPPPSTPTAAAAAGGGEGGSGGGGGARPRRTTISPRKRYSRQSRAQLGAPHSHRPCLDFEKMQQVCKETFYLLGLGLC